MNYKAWTPPHRLVTVYSGSIPNTNRVERILNLIVFLNQYRTRKQIAQHLGISYKTVGRYINLLTVLGFEVDRMFGKYNSFKILNTKEFFKLE
mgnify:CR=1 FL=1